MDARREAAERLRHDDARAIARALNELTEHLVRQGDSDRAGEREKGGRDRLTLALVFLTLTATGIGDWFFYGQREEMVRAYEPVVRSSTANRAYIIAKLEPSLRTPLVFHKTEQVVSFSITMKFSIKNYGQTPGVITKIETHMLISDKTKADGSLGQIKQENPPDPTAPGSIPLRETFAQPIITKDGTITDRYAGIQVVAPEGWDSGVLEQTFSFDRPATINASTANIGTWFYCLITYRDVFGFERQSSLYFGNYGSAASFPRDSRFNFWK